MLIKWRCTQPNLTITKHNLFEIMARHSIKKWKLAKDRCFSSGLGMCFECFSGPRRVFQIHEKSWFFTTYRSKKRSCAKPFDYTVLGSYFMKSNDILTKWILKTYYMWEKCVQIMYSSINNPKNLYKVAQTRVGFGRHISSAPVLL